MRVHFWHHRFSRQVVYDAAAVAKNRLTADPVGLSTHLPAAGCNGNGKKMCGAISAVFRLAAVPRRAEDDPTWALRDSLLPPNATGTAAITDEKTFGALLRSFDEFTCWPIIVEAMKFQMLTMTRPGETRGAKKSEFDLENRIGTIPAERMEIVEANWFQIEEVELHFPSLFSNRKRLSENASNAVFRRMGNAKEEVTSHGFRVTAGTILHDRGYDGDVIEAALADQDKNAIRRTYNRSTYWDQRVKLMQEWADLVDK